MTKKFKNRNCLEENPLNEGTVTSYPQNKIFEVPHARKNRNSQLAENNQKQLQHCIFTVLQ